MSARSRCCPKCGCWLDLHARDTVAKQQRRARGLCVVRGCPVRCETYYCAQHAEQRRRRAKMTRRRRHPLLRVDAA